MAKKKRQSEPALAVADDYEQFLAGVVSLLDAARRTTARTVNAIMVRAATEAADGQPVL